MTNFVADNGIVVFDDVTEGTWNRVVRVFSRALQEDAFEELGKDGRIGVLQVRPGRREASASV